MCDFVNKSVIVTGSSSGIGEYTALLFASRGANVTICGRDDTKVQHVVGKCHTAGQNSGHGNKFIGVAGDMTNPAHRQDVVDKTIAAFGKFDVLVVNHGTGKMSMGLDGMTEETYDHVFNTNTKSVVFLIKAAVKHLEKSKGCIVVTSSVSSTAPSPTMIDYKMSKAALDQMVRCLALDLGPKGIRINAINPTFVATSFFRDGKENLFASEVGLFCAKSHPLGERFSTPEEQADVIAFLASEGARFVTGECLRIDGGLAVKGNPLNYFVPSSPPVAN